MPRDSDYCGGGYETRISDNGTTTNTSWGDCGSGPVINITGGSNSSRDYPSGSGRGDHDGGGRGEQNSHGTGVSGSSISDRARARRNAEEKEKFESKLESLTSYPHAHIFPNYDSFCYYAFDHPVKTGGRFIISLPPEPDVAIKALGRTIGVRSLAPGISTNKVGWGSNVLANVEELLLCHNRLSDKQLDPLIESLHWQNFTLKKLDLSYNHLTSASMPKLMYAISNVTLPSKAVHNIAVLNLSNNNLGDPAAKVISDALAFGQFPATKSIDLSGNKITPPGETKLVQALKGKVQDMVIITQKLEQNSKLLPGIGTKEEKIALYKEFIRQGVEKGTNDQAVVVDKSFFGTMKNIGNSIQVSINGAVGFAKCNWEPEDMAKGYAQDKITAKISKAFSKILGKATSVEGVVTCYLEGTEAAWTSLEGQKLLQQELCVMGESEFCGE